MRVVIDSSVLVAGLRSRKGASRLWLDLALAGQFTMLLSVPLVLEYEDVLLRPAILQACQLKATDVGNLIDAFCAIGDAVELA